MSRSIDFSYVSTIFRFSVKACSDGVLCFDLNFIATPKMIIKNVIYHFIFTIVLKDVRDGIVHFIMFITSKQKIYQYNYAK